MDDEDVITKNDTSAPYKRRKTKNRASKTVLKFDDTKRAEYLTGFRKRRNERKEKAKQDNERLLKEARATLRRKAKEARKKKLKELIENFDTNKEEDGLTKFEEDKEVFEDEDTTVTVAAIDIAR